MDLWKAFTNLQEGVFKQFDARQLCG